MNSRLAVLALLCASGSAWGDDAGVPSLAARVGRSVVRLSDIDDGEENGHGSGFFVRPGVVVTNHHVIAEVSGDLVATFSDGSKMRMLGVLADDEVHDLALLRAESDGPPPLTLAPLASLHVSERVVAVGSPLGFDQTFSTGTISALRDDYPKDWKKHGGHAAGPLVQHTAAISPGSSGGPVVDEDGRVVGVNHSYIEGASMSFAAREDVLATLLGKTDLRQKPRALGPDVLRNIAISAAVTVVFALVFGLGWYFASRRGRGRHFRSS